MNKLRKIVPSNDFHLKRGDCPEKLSERGELMKGGATSLTFGNGGTRAKGGTMIIKGGLRTLDETMVPSPRMPCFARIRRLAVLGTQFFAQFCHFFVIFWP